MSQIIGIDLGTTNSVVSYYKDGRVKVLSLEGHTTTPSVLLFDGDKIEVGHKAKNRMAIVYKKRYGYRCNIRHRRSADNSNDGSQPNS